MRTKRNAQSSGRAGAREMNLETICVSLRGMTTPF